MKKGKVFIFILLIFFLTNCAEKAFYKKVKKSNTIEGYENYLSKYENGKYAVEAKQKIEDIKFYHLLDSMFLSFTKKYNPNTNSNKPEILINPSNEVLMGTPISIQINHLPSSGIFIDYQLISKNTDAIKQNYADDLPDTRNTLYWNPDIIIDKNFKINFKTSDSNGKYNVILRAINMNDEVFLNSTSFIVK